MQISNTKVNSVVSPENLLKIIQEKSDNIQAMQKEEEKKLFEHSKGELKEKLQNITKSLNKEMRSISTDIQFGFIETTDTFYVSIVDTKTQKEIRRFPTDEALKLMETMREVVGQIFDTKG